MITNSSQYLSNLHKEMDARFSLGEVHTLCFNLGIDYENVPGDTRSIQIRNLLISLAKQGNDRLQELIDMVRMERPRTPWQDVPLDFQLPPSVANEDLRQVVHYTVYGNVVQGDSITVRDIINSQGLAIGRQASATVTTYYNLVDSPLDIPFATLQTLVDQQAPALSPKVNALKEQVALGSGADDSQVAGLVQDLAEGVPASRATFKSLFDTPAASAAIGPATKFVLNRLI
jgi:hypothetical protein